MRSEHLRSGGELRTEPAQQRHAALEAHQRDSTGRPGTPRPAGRRPVRAGRRRRRAADRVASLENSPAVNACKLATPGPRSGRTVARWRLRRSASRRPRPASSSTLTTARSIIARARRGASSASSVELGLAVDAARLEVAPAAVERDVQVGVARARDVGDLGGSRRQRDVVDAEPRRVAVPGPPQQVACALADRRRACAARPRLRRPVRWPLEFGARGVHRTHPSSPRPLAFLQFVGVRHRAGGEVAGGHLGVDLDPRVGRDQVVGDVDPLADLDARAGDGVVLHVAHRDQAVDLADAQPVQHVGHQLLEAHVLHAGHAFGAGEVLVGRVAALLALARVVDQELGHLAERAALLAGVGDQADAAALRALDAFLDRVREVRPAGADVGAEHVGAVALVVHARGQLDRRDRPGRAGRRRCRPSARRSAAGTPRGRARVTSSGYMPPVSSNSTRRRSVSLQPKRCATPGQVPDRLDRRLGDQRRAARQQDACRRGAAGPSARPR